MRLFSLLNILFVGVSSQAQFQDNALCRASAVKAAVQHVANNEPTYFLGQNLGIWIKGAAVEEVDTIAVVIYKADHQPTFPWGRQVYVRVDSKSKKCVALEAKDSGDGS